MKRINLLSSQCHSDASGQSAKFQCSFPIVLGHEAAGVVESVGEGVTSVKAGDHVITLFLPQCRECKPCQHETANFCVHFVQQINGLMLDGTSRMSCRGQQLHTFVGCGTFSEYTVVLEMNLTKINERAPLDKVCLFSCGLTTGYGAALNTAKVKPGSSCAIWGLGALGLAAVMGCKKSGATRIIAIDINPGKFDIAKQFGATEFINPTEIEKPIQEHLREITGGVGVDYTFECVGSVELMRQAFESASIGYGVCVFIGVSPSGQEMKVMPIDFQLGRTLKGTLFGCYKSVDSVPKLVEEFLSGDISVDGFITHNMKLEQINEAFALMKEGKSIRTVIHM